MRKYFFALMLLLATTNAHGQSAVARQAGEQMLDYMFKDLRAFYYDPAFGNVDLDVQLKSSRAAIKTYRNDTELVSILANALKPLHDSHTFFIPPAYEQAIDYGFEIRFYGDEAIVTKVKAGSSAEQVGLRPGDVVRSIDGQPLTRATFNELAYEYFMVAPRDRVRLIVSTVSGATKQLVVATRIEQGAFDTRAGWGTEIRIRLYEDSLAKEYAHVSGPVTDKVFLWRMTAFNLSNGEIGKIIEKARKCESMVIDLRGNAGGSIKVLQKVVSYLFSKETEIAKLKYRSKTETLRAKPEEDGFKGKVILLVDSESASASEMLARLVQITGRGKVVGDRTAGAVRISRRFSYFANEIEAGASVTVADVIMPDGKSIEGVGVSPDEFVVLKNYNIAEHTDPMLSYALSLAGYEIEAAAAAKLFLGKKASN